MKVYTSCPHGKKKDTKKETAAGQMGSFLHARVVSFSVYVNEKAYLLDEICERCRTKKHRHTFQCELAFNVRHNVTMTGSVRNKSQKYL